MQTGTLNILITAPSLDPKKNVSGISSVVQTIIAHNDKHIYFHYLLGRPDKVSRLGWIFLLVKQLLFFPVALFRQKINIVHQNFPFDPKGILREFIINEWCKLFRIPVVLHIHGGIFLMNKTNNRLYLFLVRKIFKNSKAVIVLSSREKEALLKNYRYAYAFVLENCIDVSEYLKNKNENPAPDPVFLFMGRIHESKGLDDILQAFQLLKKDGLAFNFVLCGDGPLRARIVPQFESVLGNRFNYLGIVSGREKSDAIKSAGYFLLPSRYGEGMPMALLETMASGLVPIVTEDASMKYVVKNEMNGLVVEKNNPPDLYRKMKQLISDPELYKTLSIQARNSIAEKCDMGDYIFQLNYIYEVASTN